MKLQEEDSGRDPLWHLQGGPAQLIGQDAHTPGQNLLPPCVSPGPGVAWSGTPGVGNQETVQSSG